MVDILDIVKFVFIAIIGIIILGLLWYAIGYGESKFPQWSVAWNLLRVLFVLLVIFLLIAVLLALIGYPVVRFGPARVQ